MKQTITATIEIDDSNKVAKGIAEMLQVFLTEEIEGHYDNITSNIIIIKKEEQCLQVL